MPQAVRRCLAALAFLFIPLLSFADVLKIVVDSTIHPITQEFIARAIQQAKTTNADALLITLRTPADSNHRHERLSRTFSRRRYL